MWLAYALKSGEATLFTKGTKTIHLKVENKRINVNLLNKEFLKDVMSVGVETEGKSILKTLKQLKNIANELKRDELTITISHKGSIVLTLGLGADPKLSKSVTRTNAIEINNLSKLMQLVF